MKIAAKTEKNSLQKVLVFVVIVFDNVNLI